MTGTATAGDDPARLLNRRYLASFGVVAALLLLNQCLVQPQILALAIDPATINRAGRQRMLSQRLAKAALAFVHAGEDAERRRYLDELKEVGPAWSAAHRTLRGSMGGASMPEESALLAVEPAFARLQDASARLIRAASTPGGDAEARAAVAAILADEATYLRLMDRAVGLYESEARARVGRLLWTGRAATGLALAALAGLGLGVLRPASWIIRRQVEELRRGRDDLEAKVRDRTADLERLNRNLEAESARRSTAEARHRAVLEGAADASRVNMMGEMASGLAHELNQPLGAIANYAEGCQVALERPDPDLDEVRAALRKLLANTLRAGEVLKSVRRFVTRRGLELEPFDPAHALFEVVSLLTDEARRLGVTLEMHAAPNLPWIQGDRVQIQQVLINLVRNAFEAVRAAQSVTGKVLAEVEPIHPGAVEFRVTDDGEGISEEAVGRIFEPFFSTRAEGMGMGLAISRTMVEAHEGTLLVESVPGVRTTFRFNLRAVGPDDGGSHGLRR